MGLFKAKKEEEVKAIGVLTSGGDAPGMNAAVRAVVRTAVHAGIKVKGIRRGYSGLLEEDFVDMTTRSVSDIIQKGGTILYTARCPEMLRPEGPEKAAYICRKSGIDALVVIGGDGSYRGALEISPKYSSCFRFALDFFLVLWYHVTMLAS